MSKIKISKTKIIRVSIIRSASYESKWRQNFTLTLTRTSSLSISPSLMVSTFLFSIFFTFDIFTFALIRVNRLFKVLWTSHAPKPVLLDIDGIGIVICQVATRSEVMVVLQSRSQSFFSIRLICLGSYPLYSLILSLTC